MKKLYLILLIFFALSSCKKDKTDQDLADLRTIAGVWKLEGDNDFTIEFIPEYGKEPGGLYTDPYTKKEGEIIIREEDVVENVRFVYQAASKTNLAVLLSDNVYYNYELIIINKNNITLTHEYRTVDPNPPAPVLPFPEGQYAKVK